MLQATPQDLSKFPNVEFRKDDFDASIWKFGYDVIIEKAVRCPCEGVDGIPLSSCSNCHGTGYFYVNPIKTIGLITGINRDSKFKEWSTELIGTISLSVRDNVDNTQEKIAFYDRVTMVRKRNDQAPVFGYHSEVLEVKQAMNGDLFVWLSYRPQKIIDIFSFRNPTQPLKRILDYEINEDNNYAVKLQEVPANGVVSVRYQHDIQYHVIDIPHEIRYSTKRDKDGRINTITLPTNAICRRSHLVQLKNNYDGTGISDNTYIKE